MDEIEEIKRRIDIVELISSYLTLKKAGSEYKALCPFHTEKTPSFMVSPEKQIFKCFGCGEGGSVFDFVMKMENLEFREALEMLAERAGVKLEHRKPQDRSQVELKSKLYQINELSASWFEKVLLGHPAGKSALKYLKERGLKPETIKQFQLGYAASPESLRKGLKSKGFSENEIRLAGSPDRFYRRITFPIRDIMANTIGFTGRTIVKEQEPKYLNTPETSIFHKGRILYNLDKARGEIKTLKNTIVVEGQMDVISSYQAGVKNIVASSGTALTDEHLEILFRYTPNITFAFDSDNAGLATAKKAYEMALQKGFNVKMVLLDEFKDPGEMIAQSHSKWQEAVANAKPVIDWYFSLAFDKRLAVVGPPAGEAGTRLAKPLTSQEKKEIAKEILPVIKKIPDTIEQAHYVGLISKKLEVPEQVVFEALTRTRQKDDETKKLRDEIKPIANRQLSSEEILIGLIILEPKDFSKIQNLISSKDFKDSSQAQVYNEVSKWYNQAKDKEIQKYLKSKLPAKIFEKIQLITFELEKLYSKEEIEPEKLSICQRLKSEKNEDLKAHYAQAIRQAEAKGDREKLKKLISEFQNAISE